MIHVEDEGDRLDHFELLSMVQLLLIAGHETTVNLIGNGIIELVSHLEEQKRLVAYPELVDPAIEEMLRFNEPVETPFPRCAYEDIEMGNQTILDGDQICPVLLGADRDLDHFGDQDRFDITRDPNKYLEFGYGVHDYLRAAVERLDVKSAISHLLDRSPELRLGVDRAALEWHPDFFLRGVRSISVVS